MDSYNFTLQLIGSNTVLDFEAFTERLLQAVLASELNEQRFMDMLSEFKSFEGKNHHFCINFTGAWLKYALGGTYNKDRMKTHKLIRDVLGDEFQEKLRGGGATPPLPNGKSHQTEMGSGVRTPFKNKEQYQTIDWSSYLDDLIEDRSTQRKYMLMECKKHQKSNNSWQTINMILLRPKDFVYVMNKSKCVSEYSHYFTVLAEIRRSYEETYLPWIIEYKDKSISRLESKVDQLVIMNQELLVNSRHIIAQNEVQADEICKLHVKIDTLFEFLLSFARTTIPTWIGSSIIKQQYDILATNKDSAYALKHLKLLFMVGFYDKFDQAVEQTKLIDGHQIKFKGRGHLKVYACCTNFADIGSRIRKLYKRYSDDPDAIMYMLKPTAIALISCEVNLEQIILENAEIFPEKSISTWESAFKCYDVVVSTGIYSKAHDIFDGICARASTERFQGYQQRIDEFNRNTATKMDDQIIDYIEEVDRQFFGATKPFCQQFIDSYSVKMVDEDDGQAVVEWAHRTPSRKFKRRPDAGNANMTTSGYTLRMIESLIIDHNSVDHIKHMTETGIISKEDIPALRAMAKFENIDVSDIEIPEELEDEFGV